MAKQVFALFFIFILIFTGCSKEDSSNFNENLIEARNTEIQREDVTEQVIPRVSDDLNNEIQEIEIEKSLEERFTDDTQSLKDCLNDIFPVLDDVSPESVDAAAQEAFSKYNITDNTECWDLYNYTYESVEDVKLFLLDSSDSEKIYTYFFDATMNCGEYNVSLGGTCKVSLEAEVLYIDIHLTY